MENEQILNEIKSELAFVRETYEELSDLRDTLKDTQNELKNMKSLVDILLKQSMWRHYTDLTDIPEGKLIQVCYFERTTKHIMRDGKYEGPIVEFAYYVDGNFVVPNSDYVPDYERKHRTEFRNHELYWREFRRPGEETVV